MKKITKAVIPAAGMGTRLLPATKSHPKEMMPVGNKPVIQYVVEEAASAGIKQILIITGSKKRSIEDHFDSDNELNAILLEKKKNGLLDEINFMEKRYKDVQIFYTRQKKPLGLGHAIYLSRDFVDQDDFVVLLGDTIIYSENIVNYLRRLMNFHKEKNAVATIGIEPIKNDNIEKYGVINPKNIDGLTCKIVGVVEKPKREQAPSNLAINGRYVFRKDIFNALKNLNPGVGGEIQLTDAIQKLIEKEPDKIWGLSLNKEEIRYDIGNILSYSCAFFDYCIRNKEIQTDFYKHVRKRLNEMNLK
ncbi:MAG: UTP--glucose-1-phosphate uridylyltransferase [Candidatus Helarchaeota archaeon]